MEQVSKGSMKDQFRSPYVIHLGSGLILSPSRHSSVATKRTRLTSVTPLVALAVPRVFTSGSPRLLELR